MSNIDKSSERSYMDSLIRLSAQVDSLLSVLSLQTGKYVEKDLVYAIFGMDCPDEAKKHKEEF